MVDYIEAIKKPFSDLKKSGLAVLFGLFGMIIFIPYLFNFGYFLECAKNSSKKELPEWGNYWEKFVRGFFLFLIFFIYAIPLLILLVFLPIITRYLTSRSENSLVIKFKISTGF